VIALILMTVLHNDIWMSGTPEARLTCAAKFDCGMDSV
jgi:hypothetical protein